MTTATEISQYLTFKLEQELFAIDVIGVNTVLEYTPITRVPKTPEYMRGVINLRGSVVPVIDLKLALGLPKTELSTDTCIIVIEIDIGGEKTVVGMVVDAVQEVIDLDQSQIQPPPRIGTRLDTRFIKGMGKKDERFIIILYIDRVFAADELSTLKGGAELAALEGVEAK